MENQNIRKKSRGRPVANKQIDIVFLLEIAIKEFADNGFDGTKQKEIAKKAGIANSLMNYRFDNKEDLWKQAVTELGKKLDKRFLEIQELFKDLQGVAALKIYTREFIYFCGEYPEFYKIVFHEMCTKTSRADWLIDNILRPINELFKQNADPTNTSHLAVNGIPVANISTIIMGAANVFFIQSYQVEKMYGINPFEPKEIEKHADIVVDLIFNSLKSKV